MRYVDREIEAYWDRERINWKERALENLKRVSDQLWTHEFRSDDGRLFAVAMMHPDGFGPSRLLLREPLAQQFPDGYLVALPEMSCGVTVSVSASRDERLKIDDLVVKCFEGGTRPLVRGVHEPSLLLGV
jgi:hypothetical protein